MPKKSLNKNSSPPMFTARVSGIFGAYYRIKDCHSGEMYLARLRGRLRLQDEKDFFSRNYLAVGDVVVYSLHSPSAPQTQAQAQIENIRERKNIFLRTDTSRQQALASNLDGVILLLTYNQPRFNSAFADRVITEAFINKIPVSLIFNKEDLKKELSAQEQDEIDEKKKVYQRLPLKIFSESLIDKISPELKNFFAQKNNIRFLLMGQSGSGKSTLLNWLYSAEGKEKPAATAEIGIKGKGRHTTTNPQLYEWTSGKEIIDIPGVREFGLMHRNLEELQQGFPEMQAFSPHCRFENCQHLQEPDCAVKDALAQGKIAQFRYASYIAMAHDREQNFKPRRGDYRLQN